MPAAWHPVYIILTLVSLIPITHPNRDQVSAQLENIQANTAAEIVQTYILKDDNGEIVSNAEKGELASSKTKDMLQVFMTEDCIMAECPSFDFVELIAKHCDIKDLTHRSLLQTALTESNIRRIQT